MTSPQSAFSAFTLPELPWAKDALAPTISAETIDYHYGKHHNAYLNALNSLVEGSKYAGKSLEELVKTPDLEAAFFNPAAQVWNHTFYWNCLSPHGGGQPTGKLLERIEKHFGSFDNFKKEFSEKAAKQFGSGWAWLVKEGDTLSIEGTSNADTPLAHGKTPLLTLDVWEHAYYIDYRNARPKYIEAFWDIVNWEFVSKNLG
jgi:Fe-Mn family superoxide dismutase